MMQTYFQLFKGLKTRGVRITDRYSSIKPEILAKKLRMSAHQVILKASEGLDESKDLGGDLYLGGDSYDEVMTRRYLRNVLDDCAIYLQDMYGNISRDMQQIYIASCIMQNKYGRYYDGTKVLATGIILNSDNIANKIATVLKSRNRIFKLNLSYVDYSSKKVDYARKYMMYLTIPSGYKCYLFEPHNIAQIAMLTSFGMDTNTMKNYVSPSGNGLIIGGINQSTETKVCDTIFRKKVYRMDGYFAQQFLTMYDNALREKYIDPNEMNTPYYYFGTLIPIMCSLMDKAFYQPYLSDLNNNLDLLESDCFINFMTPWSVSVCIREDLDINYILPSVAKKMTFVNPMINFGNILNYC